MTNCIGALVRRRDGDTSVVWIIDIGFCNLKNIKQQYRENNPPSMEDTDRLLSLHERFGHTKQIII